MLNLIPVSSLSRKVLQGPEPISCPICLRTLAAEDEKRRHLDSAHPDWALNLMSAWLRSVPRENG